MESCHLKDKFAIRVVNWQKKHGRHHLPWQGLKDPYLVWLSEIMLQQTQVTTVVQYYLRFLKQFPSLEDLAKADIDVVLGLWSGLGYYTRARNLHRCAKMVLDEYGGEFPQRVDQLVLLPGIGPSTAAAIAAFCFDERVSILDGNVKRVLTRVMAYDKDIGKSSTDKELWEMAQTLLPRRATDMPTYTQGLMDLGATICLPKCANCECCPLNDLCIGHKQGKELLFPFKPKKIKRSTRISYLLWLESSSEVVLVKRPETGVWGGLFSLPTFDSLGELEQAIEGLPCASKEILPMFKHVLTHFDWMLQVVHVCLPEGEDLRSVAQRECIDGQWHGLQSALSLGLPAPVRKLLEMHIA